MINLRSIPLLEIFSGWVLQPSVLSHTKAPLHQRKVANALEVTHWQADLQRAEAASIAQVSQLKRT